MSKNNRPEGSAPAPYPVTLSAEQAIAFADMARLAKLGARVLEIVATNYPQGEHGAQGKRKPFADANTVLEVCAVARSLGLMGEEKKA